MSRALVLVAVLGLTAGCSCAATVGLLGLGVAGHAIARDPVTAAAVALDLGPAACRACVKFNSQ